jgi:hypothetical protein
LLLTGAVQETYACVSPAIALTPVGAAGIPAPSGTTLLGADSGLEPCALLAET